MSVFTNTDLPAVKPAPSLEQELLCSIEEAGQVIIHASITCKAWWELVRIWKTTYLIDKNAGHRSQLLLASNISLAPNWTPIVQGQTIRFTLVFESLPKNCSSFDFAEIIPEPGGFIIRDIARNQTDVYRIDLSNPE